MNKEFTGRVKGAKFHELVSKEDGRLTIKKLINTIKVENNASLNLALKMAFVHEKYSITKASGMHLVILRIQNVRYSLMFLKSLLYQEHNINVIIRNISESFASNDTEIREPVSK